MLEEALDIVGVHGVEDVEEVDSVGGIRLGLLLREEFSQLRLLHGICDEIGDAELVVLRYHDGAQLCLGYEVFLSREDLLDEVFGELLLGREVVLA